MSGALLLSCAGPVTLTGPLGEGGIRVIAGETNRKEGYKYTLILAGQGNPNLVSSDTLAAASVGSLFLRTNGGSATTLYVREPSGWTPK